MFDKRANYIGETISPQYKTCAFCGKTIYSSDFSYNHNMCWECFKHKVYAIVLKCETPADCGIIIHLLNFFVNNDPQRKL